MIINSQAKTLFQGHPPSTFQTVVTVALLALIPVVVALYHDIHRPYLTTIDGDIVFAYEALRLNSGLSQHTTVHPGYTHYVFLAWWLKVMKFFGLATVHSLKDLPTLTSAAFEIAYAEVIYSIRYFLAAFSAVFIAFFFTGIRYLTNSYAIAVGVSLVFATSVGLEVHTLMTYPESISTFFWFLSLMFLVQMSRERNSIIGKMFLCGIFVILAMLAKTQVIPIVLALPVLAILFGPQFDAQSNRYAPFLPPSDERITITYLCALTLVIPAIVMIISSIINSGGSGTYQLLTTLLVLGCFALYATLYDVGRKSTAVAFCGLAGGVAVGFYAALLYPNIQVIDNVANFLDQLFTYGAGGHRNATLNSPSFNTIIDPLIRGLSVTLWHRFVAVDPLNNALGLVNWFVLMGIVATMVRGLTRVHLQILALLGLSILTESVFYVYHIENKVLIYFELPLLIAMALTLGILDVKLKVSRFRTAPAILVLVMVVIQSYILTQDAVIARPYPPSDSCGITKAYAAPIARGFERYCVTSGG
jgi:hypothetical protein